MGGEFKNTRTYGGILGKSYFHIWDFSNILESLCIELFGNMKFGVRKFGFFKITVITWNLKYASPTNETLEIRRFEILRFESWQKFEIRQLENLKIWKVEHSKRWQFENSEMCSLKIETLEIKNMVSHLYQHFWRWAPEND